MSPAVTGRGHQIAYQIGSSRIRREAPVSRPIWGRRDKTPLVSQRTSQQLSQPPQGGGR